MPHVWGPLKYFLDEMGFALCGVGEDDGVEKEEGEWPPFSPSLALIGVVNLSVHRIN